MCMCPLSVHSSFSIMEMLLFVVTISVGTSYGNDILTLIFSVPIIS